MTIQAIYKDGVFQPLVAVELAENSPVELTIRTIPAECQAQPSGDARPLLELAEALSGLPFDNSAPTDLSIQHDHYLYGTPKRS